MDIHTRQNIPGDRIAVVAHKTRLLSELLEEAAVVDRMVTTDVALLAKDVQCEIDALWKASQG